MKNLLLKIQTELKAIEGIRESDVYLSVDPGIIPERVKYPCIGIKDGNVDFTELAGDAEEGELKIDLYIYEKFLKGDDEVIRIMETAEKTHTALRENYLDGYVKSVCGKSEDGIQVLYKKGMDAIILMKRISYQYEREV